MWGVGVIGSGPGVRGLHIPTLGRFANSFQVRHVADAGSGRAVAIADAIGASHSVGTRELLDDPNVDVIVVCSPPSLHATHIMEAVEAGKRGIFCEKPLGISTREARRAILAAREAETALVIGTNHLYDPAWIRTKRHFDLRRERVRALDITLCLPPNERYHALVSEPTGALEPPKDSGPNLDSPDVRARVMRRLVTGLAIHDLPLIRDLVGGSLEVAYARSLSPLGFIIGAYAEEVPVQFTAAMLPIGADALWRFSIDTEEDLIDIDFPPSFVHAGSAAVTVKNREGRITQYPRYKSDGYEGAWRALLEQLESNAPTEYEELVEDVEFALALAEDAASLVGGRAP